MARRRRGFLRIASSVAAVLVFGVLSWSIYSYATSVSILTVSTLAETKAVRLPDGTQVTLNRYTSLTYPDKFKEKNREVSLRGEAYFDVTKDEIHPFIVQTDAAHVRVLGTEFNVEAYPKDEQVRATLFEGSVAFETENNPNLILAPGESAVYDKETKYLAKEVVSRLNDEIAWQTGAFIFNHLTLKEITRQLSNAFGVELRVRDAAMANYKMNARFVNNESLSDILTLLQDAGGFDVKQLNETSFEIIHKESENKN